jgi:hypothetical protein
MNSLEFIIKLGIGKEIDSMNDDMVFFWLGIGVLGLKRGSVKGSADVNIHLDFEVLDIIGPDCFLGLVFIGFESSSVENDKYCSFDIIQIFCHDGCLKAFFLEPLEMLLIHGLKLLLLVVDINDFYVGWNGISIEYFGRRGVGLFNN